MTAPKPMKKWKKFERLVAALHHLSAAGATVRWNEVIDGRQFDVTIRNHFADYDYLSLVEVKDYDIEVSDVDAFVTKMRDTNANKGVMVSSVGAQAGAKKVAKRHGIDLFTLKEIDALPEFVIEEGLTPAYHITEIAFNTRSGTILLPTDADELAYVMKHGVICHDGQQQTLHSFIDTARPTWELKARPTATVELPLPQDSILVIPHEPGVRATGLQFNVELTTATIIDTGGVDVNVLSPTFAFANLATGDTRNVPGASVPLGFDTRIKPGTFYEHRFIHQVTYVERIDEEGWATLITVASYQHGDLLQCTYRQKLRPPYYVEEITDPARIEKYQHMLEHYRSIKPARPPRAASITPNDGCLCGSGKPMRACHGQLAGGAPFILIKMTKRR